MSNDARGPSLFRLLLITRPDGVESIPHTSCDKKFEKILRNLQLTGMITVFKTEYPRTRHKSHFTTKIKSDKHRAGDTVNKRESEISK
jgi:hypothetical protein